MPTVTAAFVAARFRQKPNTSRARQAFTHTRILGEHTANVKQLVLMRSFAIGKTPSRTGRTGERNSCRHLPALIRAAMIHSTITGLEKDEPAHEKK